MRANKYLLLASSVGVLALLVGAATLENFFTEWRQIQSVAHADGPVPQQLRQVIVPALGASDRCVSCHVSMAPGEQNVTGHKVLLVHKNVVHDPTEWGCTVCHAGQGRATTKADAHGDVHFWPEPMIPAKFSYAGCGTCHTLSDAGTTGTIGPCSGATAMVTVPTPGEYVALGAARQAAWALQARAGDDRLPEWVAPTDLTRDPEDTKAGTVVRDRYRSLREQVHPSTRT